MQVTVPGAAKKKKSKIDSSGQKPGSGRQLASQVMASNATSLADGSKRKKEKQSEMPSVVDGPSLSDA